MGRAAEDSSFAPSPPGKGWNKSPIPGRFTTPLGQRIFSGVTCVTRSDCWAVGAGASGIEHWHHTAWSIVATPNASLSSVACATRSDCWAVGFATNGTVNQTVAEHGTRHHHPNRGH